MQHIVQRAIVGSSATRTELARRAGVSPSTITRIEKGLVDPTLGMASRILAAAGLQMPGRAEQLCNPEALRVARAILDEGGEILANDSELEETLKRWASPDGSPRPRALAREAAAAAPAPCRPGAIEVMTDWNFLHVCSAVAATRTGWAVSGAPAAARIGADDLPGPIVLYVEEPRRIAGTINRPGASAVDVIVLPFDGFSEAGSWNDEGIVWADTIQIILDCYGMPGTSRQAEQLTEDWETDDD